MSEHDDDADVPEEAARGLVRGWVLAKTMPLMIKLGTYLILLLAVVAGGGLAWWRARRAVRKGALDDQRDSQLEPLPSDVVKERGLLAWIRGEGP
jgi:hypothetical protein